MESLSKQYGIANNSGSTGRTADFQKTPGDIWIGDPIWDPPFRGYIEFNYDSYFRDNPDVEVWSVELHVYISDTGASSAIYNISNLHELVYAVGGTGFCGQYHLSGQPGYDIWDAIDTGDFLGSVSGPLNEGWNTLSVQPFFLEKTYSCPYGSQDLPSIALGFYESGDDHDEIIIEGQGSGMEPYLVVKYDKEVCN